MKLAQFSLGIVLLLFVWLVVPSNVQAVGYDLIAPSGELTRGQDVQFIVDIDATGESITSTTVGMTYQNESLQYVSVTPGDAMTSVTASQTANNTLLLTGTNSAGFSSSGVFAYVTFKIIATAPGTAQLCALFEPGTTPTPAPAKPTTPPAVPTALPVTGTLENMTGFTLLGGVLLMSSLISLSLLKRSSTFSRSKNKK